MKKKLYAKLINNKKDRDLEKFDLGHIFKIRAIFNYSVPRFKL